jgi:hypothetical protein
VHRLEYRDVVTGRWSTSVDFAVPYLPEYPSDLPMIVPLGLPLRRHLLDLDVRDETGARLTVLTRAENAALATEILTFQAEEALGVPTLPQGVVHRLKELTGDLLSQDDYEPDPDVRRARASIALAYIRGLSSAERRSAEDELLLYLWHDDAMRQLMRLFEERFMLCVVLRGTTAENRFPRRQIVTYSFDRDFVVEGGTSLRRRLKQDLGLSPYSGSLSLRALNGAQSHHVQIDTPTELFVFETTLASWVLERPKEDASRWERRTVAQDGRTNRAHLYHPAVRPPDPSRGEVGALARLEFSLSVRFGVLLPALVSTSLTTGVLLSGLLLNWRGIAPASDATAVLLAATALSTPWVLPGDHLLVRRMFRTLRILLLASAFSGFFAAGALATNASRSSIALAWVLAGAMSTLSTLVLAAAARVAWRDSRPLSPGR